MKTVQISSDPFSRETVIRAKAPAGKECDWCGSPARFIYGSESPMGRKSFQKRVFCSRSCSRDFNS